MIVSQAATPPSGAYILTMSTGAVHVEQTTLSLFNRVQNCLEMGALFGRYRPYPEEYGGPQL